MDSKSLYPFGAALLAGFGGDAAATLIIERDDGLRIALPASHFFRAEDKFTPIERLALARAGGRVLDVGAGTGLHSRVLQELGLDVTAIDLCPPAVEIMRRRGVEQARSADVFELHGEVYDTVLMLGHGIGMVETIAGLERLLDHLHSLVSPTGQVLLDSLDVRHTQDPAHLAYQEANRRAGRYVGEIRIRFEFRGEAGPGCGWLHVDFETLFQQATKAGWRCEELIEDAGGDYLARLSESHPA